MRINVEIKKAGLMRKVCPMNNYCSKVFLAVTAAMLLTSVAVQVDAFAQGDVRQVPGEITWIDLQSGQLQLQTNTSPIGNIIDFRINREQTRVVNPADQSLDINDLHPGQNVTIDVSNGQGDAIVQNITTEVSPSSDYLEAYGQIGTVDLLGNSFTLSGAQRVGTKEQNKVTSFIFDPQNIVVTQSPSKGPFDAQMRTGQIVRIEYAMKDDQRMVRSITVFSPEIISEPAVVIPVTFEADSLVGPRGPTGPAGLAGPQGLTGPTGPAGIAIAGSTGATGPVGPMGQQGLTGPAGIAGDVVRGPMGATGDAGPRGEQGTIGQAGAQGDSVTGAIGPMGAAGPQGPQGATGAAGAAGSTTFGPAGPVGFTGQAGQQGALGEDGSKGSTTDGIDGSAGAVGAQGGTGAIGSEGDQGAAGRVDHWVYYKEFNFGPNDIYLSIAGLNKISEIAAYMKNNPSLQLGIEGTNDQHLNLIQQALIKEGVSTEKIILGKFGDPSHRRDGRVAVFFKTV